jgi:tRNA (cytidine/uridine-2'-O-)-methyltransferase
MRSTRARPAAISPGVIWPRDQSQSERPAGRQREQRVEEDEDALGDREHPHAGEIRHEVGRHGAPHRGALHVGAGKQLHGQDVGVAVDDAADEGGALLRHPQGALLSLRHEVAHEHHVADHPQQHRQREPEAHRGERDENHDRVGRDEHHDVEGLDRHVPERGPDLGDAVREASGEIALEVGERVAERIQVRAPADAVGELGHHHLVDHALVDDVGDGAEDEEQHRDRDQERAVLLPQVAGRRAGEEIDEPADAEQQHGFHRGEHEGGEQHDAEITPHVAQIERHEAPELVGRRAPLVERRENVDPAFQPVGETLQHGPIQKLRSHIRRGGPEARAPDGPRAWVPLETGPIIPSRSVQSVIRLGLYQPDIPQNAGTMLRLAACLGVPVEIVEPAGFDVSDRHLRRSGMDYLERAGVTRHVSWRAFEAWRADAGARLVLATTRGALPYTDFAYHPDDIVLVGRESAGVPMRSTPRRMPACSSPCSRACAPSTWRVSAAMILGEALRQTGSSRGHPLSPPAGGVG